MRRFGHFTLRQTAATEHQHGAKHQEGKAMYKTTLLIPILASVLLAGGFEVSSLTGHGHQDAAIPGEAATLAVAAPPVSAPKERGVKAHGQRLAPAPFPTSRLGFDAGSAPGGDAYGCFTFWHTSRGAIEANQTSAVIDAKDFDINNNTKGCEAGFFLDNKAQTSFGRGYSNEMSAVFVPTGCYAHIWRGEFSGEAQYLPPGYWALEDAGWNDSVSSVECKCQNLVSDYQPRFYFDGVDDYAAAPEGVWFDGSYFTITAWVKPYAHEPYARILHFGNNKQDSVILGASYGSNGNPYLAIWKDGLQSVVVSDVAIPLNEWTYIAATFNAGTGQIYVNGDRVGSKSLYSPKNVIRTKNYLGRSIWSDHDNFKGQMQDIRILGIGLDQEQILGLMNTSGFDWTYEFALALYKRTDATDTKLLDFSQYQNNGTMHR